MIWIAVRINDWKEPDENEIEYVGDHYKEVRDWVCGERFDWTYGLKRVSAGCYDIFQAPNYFRTVTYSVMREDVAMAMGYDLWAIKRSRELAQALPLEKVTD